MNLIDREVPIQPKFSSDYAPFMAARLPLMLRRSFINAIVYFRTAETFGGANGPAGNQKRMGTAGTQEEVELRISMAIMLQLSIRDWTPRRSPAVIGSPQPWTE